MFDTNRRDTAQDYLRCLQRIMADLPYTRHPGDVSRPDVIGYQRRQQAAGRKASRIDAELSILRQFYAWMRDAGTVDFNPAENIPKLAPWKSRTE